MKKDCIIRFVDELCEKYKDTVDLLIIRDLAMIVLSFAGFLRFDELSELHVSDVSFNDSHVSLKIK